MGRNKNGFNTRFPYAGLFFIIALVVAVPLTVWSVRNVSTQTQQQAQINTPYPTAWPFKNTCMESGGMCYTGMCMEKYGLYKHSGNCDLTTKYRYCCSKVPQLSPTTQPVPTCKPRPACLSANPPCLIPVTSDMCPAN